MVTLNAKLRFSNVAEAIDLTPKAFRNWLQRYPLRIISEHRTEGWTEFTLGDVAVLALTRELARWGIEIEEANEIAFVYLKQKCGPIFQYRSAPPQAFISSLNGAVLGLHLPDEDDGPYVLTSRSPDGVVGPSCLWVDPQVVILAAFQRIEMPAGDESTEG